MTSLKKPPSSGPARAPSEYADALTPMLVPVAPFGKTEVSNATPVPSTSAAPIPRKALSAMSISNEGAIGRKTDETLIITAPATKRRLRP